MPQQSWIAFDPFQYKSLIFINFPINNQPTIALIILSKLEGLRL
jgi:hypothetical protein